MNINVKENRQGNNRKWTMERHIPKLGANTQNENKNTNNKQGKQQTNKTPHNYTTGKERQN